MEAVLKIGGSLAEDPDSLRKLCEKLSEYSKTHKILIVPGGGEFADTVRNIDKRFGLSSRAAHKMAIMAMDKYGLLLCDLTPDSYVTYTNEKTKQGMLPIFLPSKLMFQKDPLENSWDVTSDTIAAYIANILQAKKLVLVTNVDGIFTEDPKQNRDTKQINELSATELMKWNKRTSVDKTLPKMIVETKLDCYVVNGKHPKRIEDILENKKSVCTRITV